MRTPSSLLTPELINALRTKPGLPRDAWYFVAGSTLSTLNRPDEAARILQFALERGPGSDDCVPSVQCQLQVARKMRESTVKLAAIAGLPKTINALFALKGVTPPHLLDEPLSRSPTMRPVDVYDVPAPRILQKGQRFFDSIYGKISKRVMGQMDRSGTEDLGIAARLMYGYILSNTSVLSAVETSFVLVAGLIPQDVSAQASLATNLVDRSGTNAERRHQVNPQLKGHLKGALNNGASLEEVRAVRAMVMQICETYGMRTLSTRDSGSYGWRTDVAEV